MSKLPYPSSYIHTFIDYQTKIPVITRDITIKIKNLSESKLIDNPLEILKVNSHNNRIRQSGNQF